MSDEHNKTHELIRIGLALADKGISISEAAIDEWMASNEDAAFPSAENPKVYTGRMAAVLTAYVDAHTGK